MTTFNRVVSVVCALAALLASAAVLAAAQLDLDGAVGQLRSAVEWLETRQSGSLRLGITIGGAPTLGGALLLLVLEWRSRPGRRAIRIRSEAGEVVTIPVETVERRLMEDLKSVPHVARAEARVAAHGSKADLALILDLHPRAVISEVTRAVSTRVRETMEQRLRVSLRVRPAITIRYEELDLRHDPDHALGREPSGESASADSAQPLRSTEQGEGVHR